MLRLLSRLAVRARSDAPVGPAENPFVAAVTAPAHVRGRAEFHARFDDLARGKRNWQLAAFASFGVSGVLAVGLVTLATQSRVTPYVVEVDKLGRAQAFGPAERLAAPDRRVLVAQIAAVVRDLRTVLPDAAAQADLVRRAYAFADQGAALFLNAHFTDPANDPRLLARELTRLVEVTGVLPVPGGTPTRQTWKVSWTERTIPHAPTALAAETAWEGYVTTRVAPPTTTAAITANPLGLYVTAVTWTQLGVAPSDGTRHPGAAASPAPQRSPTDATPPSAMPARDTAGHTAGLTRPPGDERTRSVPPTPRSAGGR
jgi:type IV secretion system protein TrbF